MRTEKEVREIMNEAVRIARDYPFLKLTEAVKVAEDIFGKRKEPITNHDK